MYICPKCSLPLSVNGACYRCESGHSYDISSKGYVNLLLSAGGGNHGDNKLMLASRRAFLSLGHYSSIPNIVSSILKRLGVLSGGERVIRILDAGCGEGYYSERLRNALLNMGIEAEIYGIDVSKDAVAMAAKSYKKVSFSVASVNKLPFSDGTFDAVVSLFAPIAESEFHRVLRNGGALITVSPSPRHLIGLKEAVYDRVYENEESTFIPVLFSACEREIYSSVMSLDNNAQIIDLFRMTPYYYKTRTENKARLEALDDLETEIGFVFCPFLKQS